VEKTWIPTGELPAAYWRALKTQPVLTAEEEKGLAVRMHQGDQQARDQLFQCNLRLVLWEARKHLHEGLPFPDLIQEGHIGLLRALDHYDPGKGYRFATYAAWWIMSTIRRAIVTDSKIIHLPAYVGPTFARYFQAANRLRLEFCREPSQEEIAEEMGIEDMELVTSLNRIGRVTAFLGDFGEGDTGGVLAVEGFDPEDLVRSLIVDELLDLLDDRERTVIVKHFGLEGKDRSTLREIGDSIGLSYERVRQIEEEALEKLRRKVRTVLRLRYGQESIGI